MFRVPNSRLTNTFGTQPVRKLGTSCIYPLPLFPSMLCPSLQRQHGRPGENISSERERERETGGKPGARLPSPRLGWARTHPPCAGCSSSMSPAGVQSSPSGSGAVGRGRSSLATAKALRVILHPWYKPCFYVFCLVTVLTPGGISSYTFKDLTGWARS